MRWTELFDDLEGEAQSYARAERDLEVADRTRAEVGRLTLLNRLRAQSGRRVTLRLIGAGPLDGVLERVGLDWVLVAGPQEVIVPMTAVVAVVDLPRESVSPEAVSPVAGRLSLASALRSLAVDRARVTVVLTDGTRLSGTPDRVGGDFVDVAEHTADVAPRAADVARRTTVAFGAIAMVLRDPGGWG